MGMSKTRARVLRSNTLLSVLTPGILVTKLIGSDRGGFARALVAGC